MRSPPPEIQKTWPKPNYIDPTTRGSVLMIVELSLLPVAMVVVFLRMWVRIAWLKRAGIDDWSMVLAMVRRPALQVVVQRVANLTLPRYSVSAPVFW
jgi:hypothetical protein